MCIRDRLGRELVLKEAIADIAGSYDLCLIDCPPSLGMLTVNALVAARVVISPVLPAPADLRGLALFRRTIERIHRINPVLELLGVIVGQYDQRKTSHREALQALQAAGFKILACVPQTVRAQEAAGAAVPLNEFAPGSPATIAYQTAAEELVKWFKDQSKK